MNVTYSHKYTVEIGKLPKYIGIFQIYVEKVITNTNYGFCAHYRYSAKYLMWYQSNFIQIISVVTTRLG